MARYRTTIIMLALLLVLGAAAVLLGTKKDTTSAVPGEPTTGPAQYVWQDDNAVVGIDVVSGTRTVSLVKDRTTTVWTITAPVKEVADPFAVGNVADVLKSLQATSVLTDSGDLPSYGLDKPAFTVTSTFSNTASTKRTLQVGNPTFDGAGYYVKTADKPTVYIVANTNIEPLRSWLDTPPVVQPTATPLLPTIAPTSAVTTTVTVTGTTGTSVATAPPAALPSNTVAASPVPVGTISGTNPITNTVPGAPNPTTPVTTRAVPVASVTP